MPDHHFTCNSEDHGPLSREFIGTSPHVRCPICGSLDITEQPSK